MLPTRPGIPLLNVHPNGFIQQLKGFWSLCPLRERDPALEQVLLEKVKR